MYHLTKTSNVSSILEFGLTPNEEGCIYLSTDWKDIIDCNYLPELYDEDSFSVLLVNSNSLNLEQDPEFDDADLAFICRTTITPNNISLIGNYKFCGMRGSQKLFKKI